MTAVTVKENNIKSPVESCFGKSEFFYLINLKTGEKKFIKNPHKDINKNSGRKAAMMLIKEGVSTVISSNFGIPVKKLFDKHKIQMVIIPEGISSLPLLKLRKNSR
ncbi:MAG: NifB/NifX family molybdenum-iron cluster-binding protein [Ignavibacteriae bacterium]|nr:NifB/NifX family molybdenum-iron cluster-binding protein [Ignavibacteriota bacterium]